MTLDELKDYFDTLPEGILSDAAEIVAETATEEFKKSFTSKAFDGNPWDPTKVTKKKGSLLVDSGGLVNSIRPSYVGTDKVVMSAGNEKVGYAKPHNEGYVGPVTVPEHTRKTKYGKAQVKSHTRQMNIPKRQFMGDSSEVNEVIKKRLQGYVNNLKIK